MVKEVGPEQSAGYKFFLALGAGEIWCPMLSLHMVQHPLFGPVMFTTDVTHIFSCKIKGKIICFLFRN